MANVKSKFFYIDCHALIFLYFFSYSFLKTIFFFLRCFDITDFLRLVFLVFFFVKGSFSMFYPGWDLYSFFFILVGGLFQYFCWNGSSFFLPEETFLHFFCRESLIIFFLSKMTGPPSPRWLMVHPLQCQHNVKKLCLCFRQRRTCGRQS